MSATNQNSTTSMSLEDITAAINMATLASADSTNKHSPPEPTNKESAPEVEVLGVKCVRIFGKGTESKRSCQNMAVPSSLKRKSPYCESCATELRELDKKRKKQKRAEEKEKKKQKENAPPKMLELVQEEKVQDSIRGYGNVKVFIPSLALLSQIVGLRFVFHHDMGSICRDSSWFPVKDCLARTQRNQQKSIWRATCHLGAEAKNGNRIWGSMLTPISFVLSNSC